jgi:hypothetical protein
MMTMAPKRATKPLKEERSAASDLGMPVALAAKIWSALVHFEEFHSPGGTRMDMDAALACLRDPDVQQWLAEMASRALVPVKRRSASRR